MKRSEALHYANAAHFLDHFFLLIFPTAALAIAPAWGQSYADILLLGSPLYVAFALGTLPAGWLGDRYDRLQLLGVFFLGCGLSCLIIAWSAGPVSLMTGLALLGGFAALYHPVGLPLVTDVGARTGRALAVNGVFGNLGLAASAAATGFLSAWFGWQAAFAVPGVLSAVLGIALLIRHRPGSPIIPGSTADAGRASAGSDRRTLMIVACVVLAAALFGGFVFNAVTISLAKFFDERLGGLAGNLSWVGASAGLVFAVAAFAQLPVGEVLDRLGARPILIFLLTGQITLLVCLSQLTGWWAFALSMLLVTMLFAEIPVTTWLISRYVPSGARSRVISVEYVLSLGMTSGAVPLLAAMHGAGFGFNIQFVLLAGAAGLVLVAAVFLPAHRIRTFPRGSQMAR
ncbi:MAG: MFS transporter [Pseudomonadota bacterium]